jgi:hypothetical protein
MAFVSYRLLAVPYMVSCAGRSRETPPAPLSCFAARLKRDGGVALRRCRPLATCAVDCSCATAEMKPQQRPFTNKHDGVSFNGAALPKLIDYSTHVEKALEQAWVHVTVLKYFYHSQS